MPSDTEMRYLIALQPPIREAMRELRRGDNYLVDGREYFVGDGSHWLGYTSFNLIPKKAIVIPLAIDHRNPSRGCVGMLNDSGRVWLSNHYLPGDALVRFLVDPNRYFTILEALTYQWGVGVRG